MSAKLSLERIVDSLAASLFGLPAYELYDPPLPTPTLAPAGSGEKIAVMQERARRRQLLFHPLDHGSMLGAEMFFLLQNGDLSRNKPAVLTKKDAKILAQRLAASGGELPKLAGRLRRVPVRMTA